jgi:hypothetical protein
MLKKHRSLVAFELEAVSTKLDRFGWSQMSSAMKDRLTKDWCNVLSPFRLEEVQNACAAIMARKPKDATNEQQVKVEINAARSKLLASTPKLPEPEAQPREVASAEFRQAEMERVGWGGSLKVKSFNHKPEERE